MASILLKKFSVGVESAVEASGRACRRVIINVEWLKTVKLFAGDVIAVVPCDRSSSTKNFAIGFVWPSQDISADTIHLSISLRLTAHVEEGHKVQIFPLSGSPSTKLPAGIPPIRDAKEAATIHLNEISTLPVTQGQHTHHNKRRDWLKLLLRESLVDLEYVTPTQVLEVIFEGKKRRFCISSISSLNDKPGTDIDVITHEMESLAVVSPMWSVGWDCEVIFSARPDGTEVPQPRQPDVEMLNHTSVKDAYSTVGGLNVQIRQIRDLLELPLARPELFKHLGLRPPRGILLHGPPGTGKTHLARAIASSVQASVLVINGPELSSAYHGETESRLRDVFKEAHEKSPCIVVLDEVDAIVPKREDGAGGEVEKRVVATLLTILDGMEEPQKDGGRVVVIGTTNRPNAIDPALRRPGRFDREIEIGVPDAEQRFSILGVLLRNTPHSISEEELRAFAFRAHGYVGADLSAVVREAGTIAIKRWLADPERGTQMQSGETPSLRLTAADLEASMPSVRPSAMRSLFIETPQIRYSEIGGQASVIQKLREAVEWPLLHPEAFTRLGVKPPKGVLLYGPPGCSKTVLARACACESGVNFLAVKGPELLNKFVGESERAVREIFRKARAASPSIIFFDEIDALATSRSLGEGETNPSHEGVLTSLLNEMDGVQELVGVTVLAATNRPDVLDSALLRPGRLDRILYVGPPDQNAREEIFKIKLKKMAVEANVDIVGLARQTDGYSGAEIVALCQEAAILTMQEDINAPYVPERLLIAAANSINRQITPEMLHKFADWAERSQGRKVRG